MARPAVVAVPVASGDGTMKIFIDPYTRRGWEKHVPETFYEEKLSCCGATLQEMFPESDESGVPAIPLNDLIKELGELGIEIGKVIEVERSGSGFCG